MLSRLRIGPKKGAVHEPSSKEELDTVLAEGISLERALHAMDMVMDGQMDEAEKLLGEESVFHKVAAGVLYFLEAVAGFEPEAVRKAISTLSVAESAASKAKDLAVTRGVKTSSFRPGAEYEMVLIESNLLTAVSMFLSESVFDALKALYKLRKTYGALEDIRKHITDTSTGQSFEPLWSGYSGTDMERFRKVYANRTEVDIAEAVNAFPQTSMDEYIISGVETCSGLMHVVLSSIPPNLIRLLSVVGFKGDRELGLGLLWRVTGTYTNIHSSLSLIALLLFFDGPLNYKDIQLPAEEERAIDEKYGSSKKAPVAVTTARMTPGQLKQTKERLKEALTRTRTHYPRGLLWQLQWGRMIAVEDLAEGTAILESDECGPSQIVQIEALLVFDRINMYLPLHRFEDAARDYIRLLDISTWSHALYYYMAAGCHLEMYRKLGEGPEAEAHKAKVNEYLEKAPAKVVGARTLMGKTMPFDHFVVRKVKQIQATAKKHGVCLADAVGTSLILEAGYFWYAHARTPAELIPESLKMLEYSASSKAKVPEDEDNQFTRELLTSIYLRLQGKPEEGFKRLEKLLPRVITPATNPPPSKVSYHAVQEPWAGPAVLYERAMFEWTQNGRKGAPQVRQWIKLLTQWDGDYELSTRINIRATAATDRLDIYRL